MQDPWFIFPKKVHSVRLRLFCFPYAGGGVRTYLPWSTELPPGVELVAVQPPGRGSFMGTDAYPDMQSLQAALLPRILPLLDRPYVLFGHSLGSRVAFELMRQLHLLQQRLPMMFIASGSKSPGSCRLKRPIHDLPDQAFIAELSRLNGTPDEVLKNQELMSYLLPLLRADFRIADTYRYQGTTVFPCPVQVFGGQADEDVPLLDLPEWGRFFQQPAQVHTFVDGHFFIESQRDAVLTVLNQLLQDLLSNCVYPNTNRQQVTWPLSQQK